MQGLIRWLTLAGTVLGVLVVAYGVVRYVAGGPVAALLIAVAILVVGPGEDLLEGWVRRTAPTPADGELRAAVVDRSTSLAFLVLLGVTVALL